MLQMHNKVHTNSVKYTKQIVNLSDSDYSNLKMIQDMKQNWSKHALQQHLVTFFSKTKTHSIEYSIYLSLKRWKKKKKKNRFLCPENKRHICVQQLSQYYYHYYYSYYWFIFTISVEPTTIFLFWVIYGYRIYICRIGMWDL